MKIIKLISIALIVVSTIFLGCVKMPFSSTSITPTETAEPTAVQTTPMSTPAHEPAIYKVFVDDYYGFKRVIDINYNPVVYENLTLHIIAGDTVIWVNDVDYKLTIVSEQGLWDRNDTRAILINRGFNYTFDKPGRYTFYIKEEPRVAHQTIIVNP